MKPIEVASADPVPAPATKPPVVAGAQKVMQPVKEGRPAEPLSTLPSLAAAPPAPPNLSGVKQATAPTPPTPAPAGFTPPSAAKPVVSAAPVAAPVTQSTASGLRIGFAPGSSTLPGNALAALKVFARERGVRSMVVTGFGDVASSDAQAQAAGLSLALARARGVASYLIAVGVPPAALRVGAEAQGQGAAIRLVD
jgi:outer membrane protein OmpA-like peptidoglycan-associated protein